MARKSKWGRHCCRPHSHQRVVFGFVRTRRCFRLLSAWRPVSFRVPESPRSVTGARAGIRRLLAVRRARFQPKLSACTSFPLGRAETVNLWCQFSQTAASGLMTRPLPRSSTRSSVFPENIASHSLQTRRLASGLILRHAISQTARGQTSSYLRFAKNFQFQSLAACHSKSLCPEDKMKLRSNPVFGKGCKTDLSTFAQITCGQWWTTQQLTAFAYFLPAISLKSDALRRKNRLQTGSGPPRLASLT